MDEHELAEMARAERQSDQDQWNRAGMGHGLWTDTIDWKRITKFRGI
jgi:hypothetical protein